MFIVQSASPGHVGHMWMWEFFLSLFFWSLSFFLVLVCNVTFCVNVIARLQSIAMPFFSICTFRRDFRSCGTAAAFYPWWWSSNSLSLVRISHCVRAMCFMWAAIILFESSLLWNKRLVGRSVGGWLADWLFVRLVCCSVLFGAVQRHAIEKNKSAV